jgi:hypothetical protein
MGDKHIGANHNNIFLKGRKKAANERTKSNLGIVKLCIEAESEKLN